MKQDHKGKDRRAEWQLSDRQKATIYEMWLRDADEGGVALHFIQERFAAWELTDGAILEIVAAERAKRRAKMATATDWAAKFGAYPAAG